MDALSFQVPWPVLLSSIVLLYRSVVLSTTTRQPPSLCLPGFLFFRLTMSILSQNFHTQYIPFAAPAWLFHTILTSLRLTNFNKSLDITQIARYNKRNERRWCVMNEPCRCTGSIVISHTFQMRGSRR